MKKIVALMVIVFVMGCTDKTVNFTVDFYDNFDYYTSFPVGPWYSNNACSAKLVDGSVSIGKGKPCLYLDLNGINYTLSIDYKGNGSIFFGIKNDSYYELKLGSWNLTFCNKTCTYVADVQDMYDEKWHNVRIVFMDSGIQVYYDNNIIINSKKKSYVESGKIGFSNLLIDNVSVKSLE